MTLHALIKEIRDAQKYNWKSDGPGGCDSHCIEHPCGKCLNPKLEPSAKMKISVLLEIIERQDQALEAIASVEHGISGRNAGRNTFRAIASNAREDVERIVRGE